MIYQCPACRGNIFYLLANTEEVRYETMLRTRFVEERLSYRPQPGELKDLTDFMHDVPAPLFACSRCGTVVREEQQPKDESTYSEDENDPSLMTQVFPRYVDAFRAKAGAYRDYLRPHAEVLEIGPHLGAFLQAAEEWNWSPTGLDVGKDTSQFIRKIGLRVHSGVIEEAGYSSCYFDGVFIWNCFEQIPDPGTTLAAIHHVLRRSGLLVIRIPNAESYRVLRTKASSELRNQALAYNNLLGFPYLYGYSLQSLVHLVERNGFEFVRGFNSELVTMPFADPTEKVVREQRSISRRIGHWSTRIVQQNGMLWGPWIEAVFRRRSPAPSDFRSPVRKIDTRFLPRSA